MNKVACFLLLFLLISCSQKQTILFVGSYTENKPAPGIKVFEFDDSNGTTKLLYEEENLINPSFLKLSENKKILFAITESKLETPGFISSYLIREDGLEEISKVSAEGRNPVHIATSPNGKYISVANYTDAGLIFYKVDKEGIIDPQSQLFTFQDSSVVAGRQDEAHIHSSNFSDDGRFLFAHDLGGDKIRAFEINDSLVLREDLNIDIAPGSGPRHFTFDVNGNFAFLLNELSGRIDIFDYDASSGKLTLKGSQKAYEEEADIYSSADIHVTPHNSYLLISNRGPVANTIVSFTILDNGLLELVDRKDSGGSTPRNFAISPDGKWVFCGNQSSDNISIFPLDSELGKIGEKQSEIKMKQVSSVQVLER